jgi:acetyl-CoA carboxylase biotin carboxyl carrier protein
VVVGHEQARAGEGVVERSECLADPIRLVPGAHHHSWLPLHGRVSCRITAHRGGTQLPNVEAHITGTVWKIECEVGQEIAEGDTVAILESMKMEMPVEAEDEGTVKAILVEEGQSVSEGDALVELE